MLITSHQSKYKKKKNYKPKRFKRKKSKSFGPNKKMIFLDHQFKLKELNNGDSYQITSKIDVVNSVDKDGIII